MHQSSTIHHEWHSIVGLEYLDQCIDAIHHQSKANVIEVNKSNNTN